MSETTFAVLTLLVLGWAVVSDLLTRANLTSPLVFTVAGFLLANPDWGVLQLSVETPALHLITELTLALLLFSDAARVNVATLRQDLGVPTRLLAIGLPLSIAMGTVLAAWFLDGYSWALALFVAATLAPTDAALSAQVINDEKVPIRLRRALNVESGLNDGIATPVVGLALAAVATEMGAAGNGESGGALQQLVIGLLVGLVVGVVSTLLINLAARRGWVENGGRRIATLAAAFCSFALAVSLDGNGFIAAFVAGISFGATLQREVTPVHVATELPELLGEVMALVVWFIFGAALVPVVLDNLDLETTVYAVLSLTVVRMLPVALALLGTGLTSRTIVFMGWFGPRGLASIVFALLAVEELGEGALVERAVATVALTVMLSVVLHGVTAGPLGRRYVRLSQAEAENVRGAIIRSRRLAHEQGSPETPSANAS
ncbi:cation:proton antiporter [Nocardioides sp. W7]|uniref:cation:proton antiporter n=1 Tax=Nocardioides sp. W7 TaxID=2931390 RepID=UPI001FCF7FD7|nr:cation:proton antiporter [Nocardioides sp. W7]